MNKSEELVYKLCTKSFLSLWSYPTPQGKGKKELCDVLVVCEPDIIIFSVKEIAFKDTGNPEVDFQRWHRKAVEESCEQIYGAERWISLNPNVITEKGEISLPFPNLVNRRIHRIAVALGSKGKAPFFFGDFGKGFIHVLNEKSLDVLLNELDTISDFVKYLTDKEDFYRSGKTTLLTGGEEDFLAFYLSNNREFPSEINTLVLEDDLWSGLSSDSQYLEKKKLDEISYIWDELIEELYQTYLDSNLISDLPYTSDNLLDIEKAIRVMARETRLARRMLAISLVDFLQSAKGKKLKSRVSEGNISEVLYVFQISKYENDRKYNMAELAGRCVVARGICQNKKIVIGINVEFSDFVKGSATTVCYLEIPEWTKEWQEQMDYLQKEFGYFIKPNAKRLQEQEYPPKN